MNIKNQTNYETEIKQYATMSFAGYFLSVLFCLLSMLISDSRFDLVWFRLSCDHGWIRSGSVNVRKQQQQQH